MFFAVKGNSVSRALPLQDMDNVAVLTFLLWDRVFIVEVGLGGGGGLSCITTNCQCLHQLLLLCN